MFEEAFEESAASGLEKFVWWIAWLRSMYLISFALVHTGLHRYSTGRIDPMKHNLDVIRRETLVRGLRRPFPPDIITTPMNR